MQSQRSVIEGRKDGTGVAINDEMTKEKRLAAIVLQPTSRPLKKDSHGKEENSTMGKRD